MSPLTLPSTKTVKLGCFFSYVVAKISAYNYIRLPSSIFREKSVWNEINSVFPQVSTIQQLNSNSLWTKFFNFFIDENDLNFQLELIADNDEIENFDFVAMNTKWLLKNLHVVRIRVVKHLICFNFRFEVSTYNKLR